jgi:serine/threonine-protein kinase RsbW
MRTTVKLDIPARHDALALLGTAVSAFVELLGGDDTLAYGVQLAIHEACANVIDHAYGAQDNGEQRVQIHLIGEPGQIMAELVDNGRPTLPTQLPGVWEQAHAPDLAYYLRQIPEPGLEQNRGRGLYLMQQLLDEIVYIPGAAQNVWRLTRRWSQA